MGWVVNIVFIDVLVSVVVVLVVGVSSIGILVLVVNSVVVILDVMLLVFRWLLWLVIILFRFVGLDIFGMNVVFVVLCGL